MRNEFSIYSQNGEDGILLWLFSVVGASSRHFLEVGIGDGAQCNCRNLANWGWTGVMMERDQKLAKKAYSMYDYGLVNVLCATAHKFLMYTRVCDLLSIDIDGNDYWIWESIQLPTEPSIVVIEYNASMGPDRAITIPLQAPDFDYLQHHAYYHGASLKALEILGRKKGYSLVGCESTGVNAFFVRDDLLKPPDVHAVPAGQAFKPNTRRTGKVHEQWERISEMDFVEVKA